jgi:hypothetical protein
MSEWTLRAEVPDGELRVWLDDLLDDRAAPPGWLHVTAAPAAISLIDRGHVVELSLDHDLGDDEGAGKGLHVIDHIAEQQVVAGRDLWPREGITIHSANAAGRTRWRALLRCRLSTHLIRGALGPRIGRGGGIERQGACAVAFPSQSDSPPRSTYTTGRA